MKYLKRYNEELKSDVYRSAAKQLQSDHPPRAAALLQHAEYIENQEKIEKARLETERKAAEWEQSKAKSKDFGMFNITITKGSVTDEVITGNFYLQMAVESDWFKDSLVDWISDGMNWSMGINFEFGLVPADEETYLAFQNESNNQIKYLINNWMWSSILWLNRMWITLVDNDLEHHVSVSEFEDKDGFEFIFNSRQDSKSFIDLLSKTLTGEKNWSSWMRKEGEATVCNELKNSIIIDEKRWANLLGRFYYNEKLEALEKLIIDFESICGVEFDESLEPVKVIEQAINYTNENGLPLPISWPKNPFTEDLYLKVLENVKRVSHNKFYRTV